MLWWVGKAGARLFIDQVSPYDPARWQSAEWRLVAGLAPEVLAPRRLPRRDSCNEKLRPLPFRECLYPPGGSASTLERGRRSRRAFHQRSSQKSPTTILMASASHASHACAGLVSHGCPQSDARGEGPSWRCRPCAGRNDARCFRLWMHFLGTFGVGWAFFGKSRWNLRSGEHETTSPCMWTPLGYNLAHILCDILMVR